MVSTSKKKMTKQRVFCNVLQGGDLALEKIIGKTAAADSAGHLGGRMCQSGRRLGRANASGGAVVRSASRGDHGESKGHAMGSLWPSGR